MQKSGPTHQRAPLPKFMKISIATVAEGAGARAARGAPLPRCAPPAAALRGRRR
jgi:hypothetical protein